MSPPPPPPPPPFKICVLSVTYDTAHLVILVFKNCMTASSNLPTILSISVTRGPLKTCVVSSVLTRATVPLKTCVVSSVLTRATVPSIRADLLKLPEGFCSRQLIFGSHLVLIYFFLISNFLELYEIKF